MFHGVGSMSIKLADLNNYDPSFTLVTFSSDEDLRHLYRARDEKIEDRTSTQVDGITNIGFIKSAHMFLIKNQRYYQLMLASLENGPQDLLSEMGIVLEKKIFTELHASKGEQLKMELFGCFAWVGVVDSIDLAMSYFSRPFYEQKISNVDLFRDGRQSGTADIDPSAHIAECAFIGEHSRVGANVQIMAGAVLGAFSEVSDNSVIYPNASIYPWVKIGKDCRIHSGAVIGADGFGYNFDKNTNIHQKVWHVGGVVIEEGVEIGANSAVDAGTFSPTIIGAGTKIDNMVQIGHNCRLGKGVVLCGHVAIGGSTTIGDFSVFGGKAGCGHGITLGKGVQVAGGALINCDWGDGSILGGHPARPLKEWMRGLAYLRKESLKETKGEERGNINL